MPLEDHVEEVVELAIRHQQTTRSHIRPQQRQKILEPLNF